MSRVDALLGRITKFAEAVQKADLDIIQEFEGSDVLPDVIERYEAEMAKLFRRELKALRKLLNQSIAKADDLPDEFNDLTFEAMLAYYANDLFISDAFKDDLMELNAKYFKEIVENIAGQMMESIDKEVAFNTLSPKTAQHIEEWSEDLADIMRLNTHEAVRDILVRGIEEGKSIQDVELELKDAKEFNRQRARTTAITEMLSASNVALQEAYIQSPAVQGKKWRHSGAKNRKQPRPNHMMMDGKVVAVDEEFEIYGSSERCMQPGDPGLSAKERVNCGCIASPVVNQRILGLSAEEKERIRQEAIEELET